MSYKKQLPLYITTFFILGISNNYFNNLPKYTLADEVIICEQIWTTKNLDVDTFRNGDTIMQAQSSEEWNKAGQERKAAWCFYNQDPELGKKYGKLYNWYAVTDKRGLAPKGWHIPSEEEWWTLRKCIKEPYNERSDKLKSITDDWETPNANNDSTGFSALPGGQRLGGVASRFVGLNKNASWWSSSAKGPGGYSIKIIDGGNFIYGNMANGTFGMAVRCIKSE